MVYTHKVISTQGFHISVGYALYMEHILGFEGDKIKVNLQYITYLVLTSKASVTEEEF